MADAIVDYAWDECFFIDKSRPSVDPDFSDQYEEMSIEDVLQAFAHLRTQLAEARNAVAGAGESAIQAIEGANRFRLRAEKAEARERKLREALRFYADEENYDAANIPGNAESQCPGVERDGGEIALQALATQEDKEEDAAMEAEKAGGQD